MPLVIWTQSCVSSVHMHIFLLVEFAESLRVIWSPEDSELMIFESDMITRRFRTSDPLHPVHSIDGETKVQTWYMWAVHTIQLINNYLKIRIQASWCLVITEYCRRVDLILPYFFIFMLFFIIFAYRWGSTIHAKIWKSDQSSSLLTLVLWF